MVDSHFVPRVFLWVPCFSFPFARSGETLNEMLYNIPYYMKFSQHANFANFEIRVSRKFAAAKFK